MKSHIRRVRHPKSIRHRNIGTKVSIGHRKDIAANPVNGSSDNAMKNNSIDPEIKVQMLNLVAKVNPSHLAAALRRMDYEIQDGVRDDTNQNLS